MPPRAWPIRIQDILDEIEKVLRHTTGVDRDSFATNEILQGDVLYRIGIMGEAVSQVPDEVKLRHPSVPWRDVRNMRNVLTHVSFGVRLDRIWDVIDNRLLPLQVQLEELLRLEGLSPGAAPKPE